MGGTSCRARVFVIDSSLGGLTLGCFSFWLLFIFGGIRSQGFQLLKEVVAKEEPGV
jgi:hypothetical protein